MARPDESAITRHKVWRRSKFNAHITHSKPFDIPEGCTRVRMNAVRHDWPIHPTEKSVVRFQIWISYNGGTKWHFLLGCTTQGGTNDKPHTYLMGNLKPVAHGHVRKVKIVIEPSLPLTTEIDVELW